MLSSWIKVYFLIVMILAKGLQGSSGSDNSQCSCYAFDWTVNSWSYGRDRCRLHKGDLVSMETVGEWEFIKTQIQNRTTYNDEWWIGLEKRDGKWKWLSNHPLTYNMWQPNEPRGQYKKCGLMAKNYPLNTYGLFTNVKCDELRGWICEYKKKDCSNNQVKWCYNSVTPTVMTISKTDPEVTTTATATSDFTISTRVRQPTVKKTTTETNFQFPSTKTTSNKDSFDHSAATKYPIPTTQYKKYTETTTTVKTDDGTATAVSRSTKKPFHILTIIIAVLVVVVVVVFLCCVVLCVCGWKLKRKGKPKPRLKHDGTNTENNTSDVIVGSSSDFHVNEHELKVIVIQPNNACTQDDSHATTYGNASDNSTDTQEVTKSSHGCLVSQMTQDVLEVRNHSNKTSLESTAKEFNQNKAKNESSNSNGKSPQEHMDLTPDDTVSKENAKVSDIYATVDKSKKKNKTTEVVYAEVKKRSKNPAGQHEDLVTYAEVTENYHDATRNVPIAPPPYHPKEYANVSTMPVRCQTK